MTPNLQTLVRCLIGVCICIVIALPAQGTEGRQTLYDFDFKGGSLENGFGRFGYSDIGMDLCHIWAGSRQSYFCGSDVNGRKQTVKLYYVPYNTDHMGWLRWGFLDAEKAFSISGGALKVILTGGAYDKGGSVGYSGKPVKSRQQYQRFLDRGVDPHGDTPLPGDASLYFKTQTATTPFPALAGKNRLSVWVLFPNPGPNRFDRQKYTSQYRRPGFTFSFYPFIDNARGGHYYHGVTNIPMGGWTRIEFDPHPYHHNGGDRNSYSHYSSGGYEAPGNGYDYFKRMVTFAFRAEEMRGKSSPVAFYVDEIDAYTVSHENEETISSVGIGFDPGSRNFDLSLTDKYRGRDCRAVYEVRYGFSPITQANFPKAQLCRITNFKRKQNNDAGRVYKPSPGYNQIWAGLRVRPRDVSRLVPGATVHFAIKDLTDRSHLTDRDPLDLTPIDVPGVGPVPRTDLIRTLSYPIHAVPYPLEIRQAQNRYVLKQKRAADIRLTPAGGTPPYGFKASRELPAGLSFSRDGIISGTPQDTGVSSVDIVLTDSRDKTLTRSLILDVQPVEICGDNLDNDGDGDTDCKDSECRDQGDCSRLVVDFGASAAQNRFGIPGWDTVIMDRYTGYLKIGTTIMVGKNRDYDFQGVMGPAMELNAGDTVLVYWKNRSKETVTFTPRISFTHSQRPLHPVRAQWEAMSQLVLGSGKAGVSRYRLNSARLARVINVNVNHSNNQQLVCDQIRISSQ